MGDQSFLRDTHRDALIVPSSRHVGSCYTEDGLAVRLGLRHADRAGDVTQILLGPGFFDSSADGLGSPRSTQVVGEQHVGDLDARVVEIHVLPPLRPGEASAPTSPGPVPTAASTHVAAESAAEAH